MKTLIVFVLASLVSASAFAADNQILMACNIKDSPNHALLSLDTEGVYTLSTDMNGENSKIIVTKNYQVTSMNDEKQVEITMNGYHGHNGMVLTLLLNEDSSAKGTGKLEAINSVCTDQQIYFNLENCIGTFKATN